MSLKYHTQKIGPSHYVLPRIGSMRTDAHAFFSEALFEATEEAMWQQLAAGASYEGVIGAYLMPDAHSGYGVPVGCVIVTDNVIIQAGSGYDISCGVLYMRVPKLKAEHVADWDQRAAFVAAVEDRVATGLGSHRPRKMPRFSHRKAQDILRGQYPAHTARRVRARLQRPRRGAGGSGGGRHRQGRPSAVPGRQSQRHRLST
jgi:tRNA-splicing ligase RtcB (3'-phosphate/5'-hydroxy nucleic acid ligase)